MQADLVLQGVKLLLEWVVMRSSCTAALLRKRLPDASVSACSKGACAGDRHAAGWRGVAAQQPANLPSHRAEFPEGEPEFVKPVTG